MLLLSSLGSFFSKRILHHSLFLRFLFLLLLQHFLPIFISPKSPKSIPIFESYGLESKIELRYTRSIAKTVNTRPWLWRSWQSSRFRHKRSVVQILISAIKSLNIIISQLQSRKDENKEKEAGNGPIKKTVNTTLDFKEFVDDNFNFQNAFILRFHF